jgi:two-component system, chemotaxis family, protein-glutamate methylesterase/glutaminase
MTKVRVMIVDDSIVIRRLLTKLVEAEPDLEVVGTAGNGQIAIEKLKLLEVDVITLDVEMPVMDGLSALKEIRKINRRLPVIMFSTLTSRGAATTIRALGNGASDYVAKPEGARDLGESMAQLREQLLPKIRALSAAADRRRNVGASNSEPSGVTTPRRGLLSLPPELMASINTDPKKARLILKPELLLVGVSTGGPNALSDFLPSFKASFPVPILVVQHMPPLFTRMLADRLDGRCELKVRELEDGVRPKAGEIWVAAGGYHMEVKSDTFGLILHATEGPQEHSCRPSVDTLFRSAVKACSRPLLATVLTGMGRDGASGAALIRKAGGCVFVQDEDSSVVWGMPGAVAADKQADGIFSLEKMSCAVEHALGVRVLASRRKSCP